MPISTNPESMEAGEYGLTRGTCFVARRLEVVAVAGLLWISCVFWVRRIFPCFFFSRFYFFFERTRPAASMRQPCLIYLSTSIYGRINLLINIRGVHNNQDLIWCVKIGVYMGFWVHRGS